MTSSASSASPTFPGPAPIDGAGSGQTPATADAAPEADGQKVLRDTDAEAVALARRLLREAPYMTLAVLHPQTGFPFASRVLTVTGDDGVPAILASALSGHSKGLAADPRCSLLAGEPGKGDPLAHPRITLQCIAESVPRDSESHHRLRDLFLARHPKSKLYIDFPDFGFSRLLPQDAALNGGFGRAYRIDSRDLVGAIAAPGPDSKATTGN